MPDLEFIRGEIEHMRLQVGRQRKEILASTGEDSYSVG